eukprot:scaffold69622_cov30-Attheya_sp.AAC.1
MQEAGWEVPDQIKSFKNPPKLRMSSASLADFKGNPADIPDGYEIINEKEDADDKEEVYSNDEKDDVANASDVSSDDDSAPKCGQSRSDKGTTKETFSVSSTSDSDSDDRSDKKPPAKREDEIKILLHGKRVVEANIDQASKRQKLNPPISAAASAVKSSSAAQVDYPALLPLISLNFGTESFLNFMLGKFPINVSNDDIMGLCYAYNFDEIPEEVFVGYEPFFGALQIYTIGVEKHMKYFQLLNDNLHSKAMMYATGFYRKNKPLHLDCTRIIMHRADDLNAIFGFCQQDMGLEVSSNVDVSQRKDPESSFAGNVLNHSTSGIESMPQTPEAFKQAVDTLLPDKGTSSAATTKSNNEIVCMIENKVVPGIAKANIAIIPQIADKLVPVVDPIASSTALSTTDNVETNLTAPEELVEAPSK